MKKFYHCFLPFVLTFIAFTSLAQSITAVTKPVKVAVFIPLYADSVFDGQVYTLDKGNLPKYVLPGLEFYNGIMMAIDSLNNEGTVAEVNIYDTKQATAELISTLSGEDMSNVGLIIAAITNTSELKTFSDFSLAQRIPLISATYPNYLGIKENPFFLLLNSSFEAHIEGLFKYMQKNYSSDSIVSVTRKGGKYEAFIKSYITNLNKTTLQKPLKMRWVNLEERNINSDLLRLDTLKNNVVFVASPMEAFGADIVKAVSVGNKYKAIAIGMPTWGNIKELNKPSCRNVDVIYSTPFLYDYKNKDLSANIVESYKDKFYSRPSDMVFKGYEVLYHFTKLLAKHGSDLVNHLGDKEFTLFNEFKPEAVKVNPAGTKADFIENKKLYFIKKREGTVKSVI